ncbi:cytochrome d ubiquinol oxidase subunit II [Rhizobium leguminosarum]|uniref:cytochrome d ubiquinol oxidase subunit II n=1 Tax=Rhizobium leguminosarum TaxID=384 RepID=UPI001030B206|nr:cytochrome d ubiquinol oxidase subunit II [Rhizobium leguminosarum]QIO76237.1 cytochrome d ubiquinol oxidase subunit II [Rhizobium leguminosarum bv. trifolii]QIO83255.1 cytochrome d ubiquinol oxidase subunit II [Rhizobium leguminosarum bv. trifolii]TAU16492.1 cytochrome d ubiquinol oxidase subunit II [Rhizobium leguminosarum]TAU34813.1 cytochrome d ubiquinol oxidase subunit II [Rhizobium leguminosarum]TAX44009.1 cytochrome d ubiquinol oxidase subunit II [Rhizobium leguminosarum]
MMEFWVAALALTIFLYVTLDGFDLGVGMLFAFDRRQNSRNHMISAIAPVWDGNETWLVLTATILFGAFPLIYSILLSAFYLPLILMLVALIFRGVAFEFRSRAGALASIWDFAFAAGSFLAAFIQGATIGALVEGLKVVGGRYAGDAFAWLSPFAVLCGLGLCIGYMLLGASWLTYKTQDDVQALAFRTLPWLLAAVLLFIAAAFVGALAIDLELLRRWTERPVIFIFPVIGAIACLALSVAVRWRVPLLPFLASVAIFGAAFGTLAVSFYPYVIPPAVTLDEAVAPQSTLAFMFWGAGIFVLPITIVYTLLVYFIFKGKVNPEQEHY